MKRSDAFHIAQESYKAIRETIIGVESYLDADVRVECNICIRVSDKYFRQAELEDDS
jgi:hypothetical protein